MLLQHGLRELKRRLRLREVCHGALLLGIVAENVALPVEHGSECTGNATGGSGYKRFVSTGVIPRSRDRVERLARAALLAEKEAQVGRMLLDVAHG